MKPFMYWLSIIALVGSLVACSGTGDAPEISAFRLKMASATAVQTSATVTSPKVSFVGSCVTIASAKELLNLVIKTKAGETTLTNLNKRSGMFCSPDGSDVLKIWVSTVDQEVAVYHHHNNSGLKTRDALAKK